jgi:UDP-N-acetylglucosamine--N-acetylmuramyl-(pentapeptide) pyrophosphoryl-undecaprenol N-acetylglucosamine transferase
VTAGECISGEAAPLVKPRTGRRLRLALVASGGGHVRQLLDLEPVWRDHDRFFLTEDTALGRSIAERERTHFMAHFAVGQARLGAPLRMVRDAARNGFSSAKVIFSERPDVLITTGAGASFFAVVCARLIGARVILLETFARFDRPSKFARWTSPLAHEIIVQSSALAAYLPRAAVFDPLKILDSPAPPKRPLLFATVGATLPFPRLVEAVAALKASGEIFEEVLIQTGVGAAAPAGAPCVETLSFDEVQAILSQADIVVCHGGTGSLITALRHGCRVIVMPRQAALKEHYDNHQAEISHAFAVRSMVTIANTTEELAVALKTARTTTPICATTDPKALIDHLRGMLASQRGRR